MRLFGYYAVHSFINQLKKILKPGVLIFILICGLMGGLIGYGAARVEDVSEEIHSESELEEAEPEAAMEEDSEEQMDITFDEAGLTIINNGELVVQVSVEDLLELGLLAIILIFLYFDMLSADKSGSKIFLMADVNLLFSAPLKPQSVLLFRLMCSIGTVLVATFYLFAQLPNLVINAGLSIWAATALLVTWFGILVVGKLLQVLLYTVFSTRMNWKKYLSPMLWGILFLLAASYLAFRKVTGLDYLQAAVRFFNAPFTRWIPFIGWLKALFVYTYEQKFLLAGLAAGLLVLGCTALIWVIWNLKADFYEDAMAQSEQTAALQAAVAEGRTAGAKRKKDRSEKIRRDSFHYGFGANIFFFKTLYNRFRFAYFGFFTKTVITYLVLVAGYYFLHMQFELPFSFVTAALVVGGFAFYRALGNPLAEDVEMSFYVMIPENMWVKLFWSVLGGSCNAFLDIIPALILAAIFSKTGIGMVLVWTLVILSVDLYGSIVSAFISLAVPAHIGQTIKSMIIVLFVYFGLLPDVVAFVLGFVFDRLVLATFCAALSNILLATIFFLLLPLFLEPKKGKRADVAPVSEEIAAKAKKDFSWIAFTCALMLGGTSVIQLAVSKLLPRLAPALMDSPYTFWILSFAPLYLLAFPIGVFMIRRTKEEKPEQNSWSFFSMLQIFFICIGCMYVGNLIGVLVNYIISLYSTVSPVNPLGSLLSDSSVWMRILFVAILAPILEEYIFRKQIINHTLQYGEKTAILFSALLFGLFHGNFSQFFYAAALGVVFGYVYVRSGKLRYSIVLHMLINFMGSVLSLWLVEHAMTDLEILEELGEVSLTPATWGLYGFILFEIFGAIVGLIILAIRWENIFYLPKDAELGKGQVAKYAFLTRGMLIFLFVSGWLFWMAL